MVVLKSIGGHWHLNTHNAFYLHNTFYCFMLRHLEQVKKSLLNSGDVILLISLLYPLEEKLDYGKEVWEEKRCL